MEAIPAPSDQERLLEPDERVLYVANADRVRAVWMAYAVREDGSLGLGYRIRLTTRAPRF
jgi:hypothetical protein